MWFKQIQLLQLTDALRFTPEELTAKIDPLTFRPCLPTMPLSAGWVSTVDEEDAPLFRIINGCIMLCLQIEEKILPASVINHELAEKIKAIEALQDRKVYQKEKMALKDELIVTLLPRAFSKFTRVYGYIDTKNQWLVIGTSNPKKIEQFCNLFKKTITEKVHPFDIKKLAPTITQWLKNQKYPTAFAIEKACVLQDPQQQSRMIRCQDQDLFAVSIQTLLKEGCEVKQIALSWHDRLQFVLTEHFVISNIKYQDDITMQADEMEAETKQQCFDADFLIMSATLTGFITDLLGLFIAEKNTKQSTIATHHVLN